MPHPSTDIYGLQGGLESDGNPLTPYKAGWPGELPPAFAEETHPLPRRDHLEPAKIHRR